VAQAGEEPEYFWRRLWVPSKGAFLDPPEDYLDPAAHAAAVEAEEKRVMKLYKKLFVMNQILWFAR
jgi:hypothetical protein